MGVVYQCATSPGSKTVLTSFRGEMWLVQRGFRSFRVVDSARSCASWAQWHSTPHSSQQAQGNLWQHFTGTGSYKGQTTSRDRAREGPYIYDVNGKRYLDALAGLFVSQLGHGRPSWPRRRPAGRAAGVHAAVVLRHPSAIELGRRVASYAARRPQPGLLHQRRRRGRRDRVEARQETTSSSRQATKHKVISPRDRLPRHHLRARCRSPACPGSKAQFEPLVPSTFRRPNTNIYRAPCTRDPEAFGRWAADQIAGRRSRTRAPTPSPRSSSSRCRTRRLLPAAAGYFSGPRDLRRVRRAAGQRRGDLRVRAAGTNVRRRALRYEPDMITCAKGSPRATPRSAR
jgi:hypothetical protein